MLIAPHLRFTTLLAGVAVLVSAGSALAADRDGGFALSFSTLEHSTVDASGKLATRVVEEFGKDGQLRATRTTTHHWAGRHLASTDRVRVDADGVVTDTLHTEYVRDEKGAVQAQRRVWANADGDTTRLEHATWERDRITVGKTTVRTVLITTEVHDAASKLIQTRYTLQKFARNKLASSDTSIFDVNGDGHEVQTARHLVEYEDKGLQRWVFDSDDQIKTHEVEVHRKDRNGRLMAVIAEIFVPVDGQEVLSGSREQQLVRRADGKLKSEQTTWFDAQGQGTKRRTTTHAWSGRERQPLSRVRWEHWAD